MHIFLWALQGFLALHTIIGAGWKFSHSAEQTMPSLKSISLLVWRSMSFFELLCSFALILPAFYTPLAFLTSVASVGIAAEMLIFTWLHISSGDKNMGPIIYWFAVVSVCALIVYGRIVLQPF